jgi:hypothetical protein
LGVDFEWVRTNEWSAGIIRLFRKMVGSQLTPPAEAAGQVVLWTSPLFEKKREEIRRFMRLALFMVASRPPVAEDLQ